MKQLEQVLHCYNTAAANYAQQFLLELEGKPLDRLLLQRFALENRKKGLMGDLGCGTGQTTYFLQQKNVKNLLGIDLSPQMIEQAKKHFDIPFEVGNMLNLKYPDNHFGSLIAFYAIVHFDYDDIALAFQEIYRVLQPKGQFLFSFHVGEEVLNVQDFLEHTVDINFYFLNVDKVLSIAKSIGFIQKEALVRYPYEGKEHPSQRAYILLEKL